MKTQFFIQPLGPKGGAGEFETCEDPVLCPNPLTSRMPNGEEADIVPKKQAARIIEHIHRQAWDIGCPSAAMPILQSRSGFWLVSVFFTREEINDLHAIAA